jgi:stage V sporulation protein D (sporulation-specific penicillin-binding protein)
LDLAIYAFGQNFNVTLIQQITAISAVANGGYLVTPHTVSSITDKNGKVIQSFDTNVRRQIISAETCKTVAKILEEGVSGDGGAKNAYVAGYRVAAKTGTSEKKERECPKCGYVGELKEKVNEDIYYACTVCKYIGFMEEFKVSEKYTCSSVAFAPSDAPEIAIIIIVDEPTKGSLYGSTIAAPYISKALKNILPYLGIDPIYTVEEIENASVKVANYKGYSVSYAQSLAEKSGLKVKIVGNGTKVTSQQPAAKSEINKNTGVIVLYTGNEAEIATVTVPNLVGKTSVAANALLVNLGLNVKIEGAQKHTVGDSVAMVVSQSVAPGTMVAPGTVITVEFRHMDGDEEPDYLG